MSFIGCVIGCFIGNSIYHDFYPLVKKKVNRYIFDKKVDDEIKRSWLE